MGIISRNSFSDSHMGYYCLLPRNCKINQPNAALIWDPGLPMKKWPTAMNTATTSITTISMKKVMRRKHMNTATSMKGPLTLTFIGRTYITGIAIDILRPRLLFIRLFRLQHAIAHDASRLSACTILTCRPPALHPPMSGSTTPYSLCLKLHSNIKFGSLFLRVSRRRNSAIASLRINMRQKNSFCLMSEIVL